MILRVHALIVQIISETRVRILQFIYIRILKGFLIIFNYLRYNMILNLII